jgi:predicted DNA-binding protein (MmcQ/YjbR family)
MVYLADENQYIVSIIIWAVVLAVGTASFITVIHFARGFFTSHAVIEKYTVGDKTYSKVTYCKDGKEVQVRNLKLYRSIPDLKVLMITAEAEIQEGTTSSFIMPKSDVTVTYVLKEKKPIMSHEEFNKAFLPLPQSVSQLSLEEIRPVLLTDIQDVIAHVQDSNSHKDFPLLNSYKIAASDNRNILILFVGDAIYGIIVSSEAVFKCLIRSDSSFVQKEMSHIDTVASLKDDIYSFVVDSSFSKIDDFFAIIDHSYHYVLLASYEEKDGKYLLSEDLVKKANSAILSYNVKISREFDPVYDRAIEEARRYKRHLTEIRKKENELDKPLVGPKDLVYEALDKVDDMIAAVKADEYKVPVQEIFDGPYVEKKPKIYVPRVVVVPSIEDELQSLKSIAPSPLKIMNFIDYVMSRKEMVSLTIDVSPNMKKHPTTMKFLASSYFALLYRGASSFVINLKMDLAEVEKLRQKHNHIVHVKNGADEDWYMFILDSTYTSYEELYDICFLSYTYTKSLYYKNMEAQQKADQANS